MAERVAFEHYCQNVYGDFAEKFTASVNPDHVASVSVDWRCGSEPLVVVSMTSGVELIRPVSAHIGEGPDMPTADRAHSLWCQVCTELGIDHG